MGDFYQQYQRAADDWYQEKPWHVERLLLWVPFRGPIYDPAAGEGTIPLTCRAWGYEAWGSDLIDRGFGETEVDFLNDPTAKLTHPIVNIVSNPPYDQLRRWVERMLDLATRKVAVLAPLMFLESINRQYFFKDTGMSSCCVFPDRVSIPPGGQGIEAKGGMRPYAWYIWDLERPPLSGQDPVVRWLHPTLERSPKW